MLAPPAIQIPALGAKRRPQRLETKLAAIAETTNQHLLDLYQAEQEMLKSIADSAALPCTAALPCSLSRAASDIDAQRTLAASRHQAKMACRRDYAEADAALRRKAYSEMHRIIQRDKRLSYAQIALTIGGSGLFLTWFWLALPQIIDMWVKTHLQ